MSLDGQQVSIFAESDAEQRRRQQIQTTLDALVDEAYNAALARGEAITNPDAWRAWKRGVYVETAKREGPGYLRGHFDRLVGGGRIREIRRCKFCEAPLGIAWFEVGEDTYCDVDCAEGRDNRVSLAEWKRKVRAEGGYTSPTTGEFVPLDQIALFKGDLEMKKPAGDS